MIWPAICCLVLTTICAFGQSLQVAPASGTPGDSLAIRIVLNAPPEKSPATLQWEFVFPAQILELGQPAVEQGSAAQISGKSLTCAERNSYTRVCILTGGQKPLANGAIATVHMKIRPHAKAGTAHLKVAKIQGVTLDLKQLDIKDADTVVTIR